MKKFLSYYLIVLTILAGYSFDVFAVTRIYNRQTGDIIDADKDDAEFDNTNNAVNTHTADTSAHDATGGVVGVSKVQNLTNKTLTSPVITTAPTAAGATWADLGTVTSFTATSGTISAFTLTTGTITNASVTSKIDFTGGADANFYSESGKTNLRGSIDSATGEAILALREEGGVVNCEINYSAGTITISGKDGVALSATNPCLVGVKSTTNGVVTTARFTSNITVTDGAASQTDGNLFGISDVNWGNAMPMFFGVIFNGTTPYFTLSRLPFQVSGAAAGDLAQLNDTDADAQGDVMILASGLTLASWVNLPITQVAWLQATYATASSVWTFSESRYTGFNFLYETVRFLFVPNQMGAAASTLLTANGGTAPVFTNTEYPYQIYRTGTCALNVYLDSDGGTDGAGAVQAQLALPYLFPNGTLSTLFVIGGRINGATTITGAQSLSGYISEGTSLMNLEYLDAAAVRTAVTNAMFSNGARAVQTFFSYPAMVN